MKISQKGFTLVEVLLLTLVVSFIGFAGWYVLNANKSVSTKESNQAISVDDKESKAVEEKSEPYENWKTYESKVGEFSFKYPSDWEAVGYLNNEVLTNEDLTGNETTLRVVSKSGTKQNAFGVTIDISNKLGEPAPFDTYPNGNTQKLSNSLTLWQEKENINYATGPSTSTCPALRTGEDKTYSSQLSNGKYVQIYGSFCWGQGLTTTYSYDEQVNSEEWADAVKIIKSFSL